jgi:rhodanese-related sulfurtransferase
VVVHCQSGLRSRKAAGVLASFGYRQVLNLDGGLAGLKSGEAETLRTLLQ